MKKKSLIAIIFLINTIVILMLSHCTYCDSKKKSSKDSIKIKTVNDDSIKNIEKMNKILENDTSANNFTTAQKLINIFLTDAEQNFVRKQEYQSSLFNAAYLATIYKPFFDNLNIEHNLNHGYYVLKNGIDSIIKADRSADSIIRVKKEAIDRKNSQSSIKAKEVYDDFPLEDESQPLLFFLNEELKELSSISEFKKDAIKTRLMDGFKDKVLTTISLIIGKHNGDISFFDRIFLKKARNWISENSSIEKSEKLLELSSIDYILLINFNQSNEFVPNFQE